MISRTGRFMAWLGGADMATLEDVPHERTRFIQMAAILLTVSATAAISMFFAMHDGIQEPSAVSICIALLWGIIILNLDRFLVISMRATRDRRRLILMALPRLLLAALIALVVSTPLVLRTFAGEIDQQMVLMQQRASAQASAQQANSAQASQARQLANSINAVNVVLTAQARVGTIQQQVRNAYQAELTAYEAWQCELYGKTCPGGSGQAGDGPLTQQRYAEYQQAIDRYNSVSAQLNAAQDDLQAKQATASAQGLVPSNASLADLQKRYDAVEQQLQVQTAETAIAIRQNTGLLAQLQALSEASSQNSTLAAARYLVLVLFFLIEILPVAVQFLLNLGPPSLYETAAQLRADAVIDSLHVKSDLTRRLEAQEAQARLDLANDRTKREEDLERRANEHVAEEMQRILDVALKQWSDEVRATLSGDTDGAPASTAEAQASRKVHDNPWYRLPDGDNI
jgi:hypothetical protein